MTSVPLPDRIHRYHILAELGRGSMGRVYLARDPRIDRKIALKVLSPRQICDADKEDVLRDRFLAEARAAGRLHHAGIVTVFDADTDPLTGDPYLAMEWVRGSTLRSLLRDRGEPLPLAQTVDVVAQVARALAYAHRQNVVHRDVKPANLLIADDGTVKVADFGIAKLVSESLTVTGQVLGTPFYMSPEQVRGEPVDGRTDLFALGAVLYECLTGRLAFGGDSLANVTFKILAVDPRPPEIYNPSLPPPLRSVVDRALQKRPEDRFQSGEELEARLHEIAATLTGGEEIRTSETVVSVAAPASGDDRPPGGVRGPAEGTTVRLRPEIGQDGGEVPDGGSEEPRRAPRPAARKAIARPWLAVAALLLLVVALVVVLVRWLDRPSPAVGGELQPVVTDAPEPPPDPVASDLVPRLRERPERPLLADPEPEPAGEIPDPKTATTDSGPTASDTSPTPPPTEPAPPSPPEAGSAAAAIKSVPPESTTAPADSGRKPAAGRKKRRPAAPAPVPTVPVEIAHNNHLALAYISVWVDGRKSFSSPLEASSFWRRLVGQRFRQTIAVPEGLHTIEVHISGLSTRFEARRAVRARFSPEEPRQLRVRLNPNNYQLKFSWKEP